MKTLLLLLPFVFNASIFNASINSQPDLNEISPCATFDDAPNPDEAETNYVWYRDHLRKQEYTKAFELWKKVYAVAPAADGERNTVYKDGIYLYEDLISKTEDAVLKEKYIDKIFELYEAVAVCFPEDGYAEGIKGFDLYYKYKNRATKEEIFDLFKQSIAKDGMKTKGFIVNPFTNLLVELFKEGKVGVSETKKYEQLILKLIDNGLKNCRGIRCKQWKIIQRYAPKQFEAFEVEKGYYDCEYYLNKYYPYFEKNPKDCDAIRTVYSRLKWGGCDEESKEMKELLKVGTNLCSVPGCDYRPISTEDKLTELEKSAEEESDPKKKAKIYMIIAKYYNTQLKNFSKSKEYALKAADHNPNWGDPYILIGRLYASSCPLCGTKRGWDCKVVVWPAIDKWVKAKTIDPSCAVEADKWIKRYENYMPKKKEIIERNFNIGDPFQVECWIQETTTIRTIDKE